MRALTSSATSTQPSSNHSEPLGLPKLDGRHVYLRAVTPEDYRYLHLFETSSHLAPRWRLRGATPMLEQWVQGHTQGVLAQFMVLTKPDSAAVGLVTAYNMNLQDGYGYVAAARFDPGSRSPAMMMGIGLFLEYVFGCWDVRKLYMEVAEYNFPQMESGIGRFFELEGRLRNHTYLAGKHWDQLTLALYRDAWTSERVQRLVQAATSG